METQGHKWSHIEPISSVGESKGGQASTFSHIFFTYLLKKKLLLVYIDLEAHLLLGDPI